ncbi:TRAP transporter permease [Clostridiaceae bacterium OttesenSCG-928-D20]|nr:TRAP transporter permease [Clostridiaceae bacterium OttesenSCG-928-D20]
MAIFKKKSAEPAIAENTSPTTTDEDIDDAMQSIMEKYDRESNIRQYKGLPKSIVRYLFVAFAAYCVLINFIPWETRVIRASFVGCLVFLIFINFPAKKGQKKLNYIPWYDIILGLVGAFAYFYFVLNFKDIIDSAMKLSSNPAVASFRIVLGVLGILITLEACRRSVGIPIVIVASAFIIYGLTQKSVQSTVYNLFYTTNGIIGTPIKAASSFIVLFVIFGSFLEKTGISQFFIDLANSIAGSSTGGPAKVAIISSALCGMVSGSSVGNTVTTGSITIPLMKKSGYKPEFAGAVEAAASTGGQIMPPIMGAAAFLMVEYLEGYSYGDIALRAILPAALYFAGIFIAVHLEAKKLGLKGLAKEELPIFWKLIVQKGYLLLPLIILVVLIMRMTMSMAAVVATIAAITLSMIKKETRLNWTKFFDALENGGRSTLTVGIACATAGVIACIITTTGLGNKLTSMIVNASFNIPFIAMFLTMITCIILGMGVPTTANYVIMATTTAPILIRMGIEPIAAHMFVFYFGIVADITPPVALAAYAGSAIAGSKPMPTAVNATMLAIAAFIVPYIFALDPALLFVNTNAFAVIRIVITSLIGIYGVASGMKGYSFGDMSVVFRIISIVAGLALIYPTVATDIIGIVGVGGINVYQHLKSNKKVTI